MELDNRILIAFNKFYSNFIKDVKTTHPDIKVTIKKNYKVIDKLSSEYILFFKSHLSEFLTNIINDDILELYSKDEFKNKNVIKGLTIDDIVSKIENDIDKQVFWNYLYILTVFLYLKNELETTEDKTQIETLFTTVITILAKIQEGTETDSLINDILDDDLRKLLTKIHKFKDDNSTSKEESSMPNNPFENMQNSMICDLAKEISNEIDVSNINIEKPEDILKMMDFSGSNNLVGDIIKKVSTKIHDKISTGQIKQEDLFGEAMSMMSSLNMGGGSGGGLGGLGGLGNLFNNPMMGEMMKAMKKGKAVPKQDAFKKSSARDRLRAKLAEKNKNKS